LLGVKAMVGRTFGRNSSSRSFFFFFLFIPSPLFLEKKLRFKDQRIIGRAVTLTFPPLLHLSLFLPPLSSPLPSYGTWREKVFISRLFSPLLPPPPPSSEIMF